MIQIITLNGREVRYDLTRKNVKNINLRIKADQSVSVSASGAVPLSVIEEFLVLKSDYILKALDRYAQLAKYTPRPKRYVDGESFRILGRDRRLKVAVASKNRVDSDGVYITLWVKDAADLQLKKKTMDRWLKAQSEEILRGVCEAVYPTFQKYGVAFPELRLRKMVSRWGSCQPQKGVLTFNTALIQAPMYCVEYVVMHEFTHFLYPDHSKRFYRQLAMLMPDWRERKKALEQTSPYADE